jgi:hypothetical protein
MSEAATKKSVEPPLLENTTIRNTGSATTIITTAINPIGGPGFDLFIAGGRYGSG